MIQPTLQSLESAVRLLGALALGLALTVYLLMEIYHRRQIARNARRLILSSKLFPPLSGEALRALWSRSGGVDRELIEDILVDMCRSPDMQLRAVVERSIIEAKISDRWLRELRSAKVSRRVRAATRLGYLHDARGILELCHAAESGSSDVRLAVTLSLGRLRDPRGVPGLLQIASKPAQEIPDLTLASALAECAVGAPGRVVKLLRAREVRQRVVGALALSEVADETVLKLLLKATQDPEPEVRAKVARALARIPHPETTQALNRLAGDPVWFVRVRALDALGQLAAISEEATMLAGLHDQVREVRYRAASALRRIGGMRGDLLETALTTLPRSSFDSLLSEWDQAGFIWEVASGLSTRDFPRFVQSRTTVKTLIAAGVVRGLAHLVLVFPDVKVRLRLLHLFLETPSPEIQTELLAFAGQPKCDRRVAAAIRLGFPDTEARVVTAAKPSLV